MKTIQISAKTDTDGHLRIDMPLAHPAMDVSLIVVMGEIPSPKGRYDCSDLVGKLKWRGDAVKVQRHLRDEWE